ncbi:hypothetical protein QAD02_015303 [Eretmocerus hayati]|uniref:Uncharacterized protein n=1 Tax=Eretmocerus hayati TaxID=131215 RepID=A0ACC2P938_9HYME|nr:hypothetical protein QAD02_015303 [Eretmocerus hayati]
MSSNGRVPTFKSSQDSSTIGGQPCNTSLDDGRAVTDAVHERFRYDSVFCDNCKEQFIGNEISISQHFNKSHPADVKCIYCSGKVYSYYKVRDDDNKAKKIHYHRCRDWL